MKGVLITFEGTEGSGKSTQVKRLAERLRAMGHTVQALREPGGTPLGEEIRHLLKHSQAGDGMTPETELLLMNASRSELVRKVIKPALERGEVVLCDRYYDSSLVYQGHGRGLDLREVRQVINFAIGGALADLTLLLRVPIEVSEQRRASRADPATDRFEQADRAFFERVEAGYNNLGASEGDRVRIIDATKSEDEVASDIWLWVSPLFLQKTVQGEVACKSVGEEGRGRE